jgi:WD40 repeat protein
MSNAGDQAPSEPQTKTKVFISYAREDKKFVDQLEAALKDRGFEPLIDRREIAALENWWERIETLITQADAVVCVLSPDSVDPKSVCQQEITFAADLNKRLAPIVWRAVEDEAVPKVLRALNFVFFEGADFDERVKVLAQALSTDIAWVRKHTEFGEQARRWAAAGRPGPRGLLLRPPVLEEAERWIASRPGDAPEPTAETQAFVAESRRAATQRRNILSASLGGGLAVALVLAGLATWQRFTAVQQRDAALLTQSRFLADLSKRNLAEGDAGTAMLLALEGLPDRRNGIDRPYSSEAEAALWAARQRLQEIKIVLEDPEGAAGLALSPDGRRIATSSYGLKAPRIWDAASGRLLRTLQAEGDEQSFFALTFTPDSRRFIAWSMYGKGRAWDVESGESTPMFNGHTEEVFTARFSPDGRRIVTASRDKSARIWDAASGRQLLVLGSFAGPVTTAAFSPDGRRVVTTSRDGTWGGPARAPVDDRTVRVWDAASGNPIIDLKHDAIASSAFFSADGRHIVTTADDDTIRVWDAAAGKLVRTLKGYAGSRAAFSPDGRRVFTTNSATVRIWDFATGRTLSILQGHANGFAGVIFNNDGSRLLTSSVVEDTTVRLWDVSAAVITLEGHTRPTLSAAFSADGRRVVTASYDGARIWDAETGEQAFPPFRHTETLTHAAFSPDGRRIVAGSYDKTARIWDVATGRLLLTLTVPAGIVDGVSFAVDEAAFSPDGKWVITRTELSDKVRIWDSTTGRQIRVMDQLDGCKSASFSRDGKQILTADRGGVRIWNAATGVLIRTIGSRDKDGPHAVESARFSPDGRRIVTGSRSSALDRAARIWDATSGELIRTLKGHTGEVRSASFSGDGRRIVTESSDLTVRIWDAESGRQLLVIKNRDIARPEFSPDGRSVVTSNGVIWRIVGPYDGSPVATAPEIQTTQDWVDETKAIVPRCLTMKARVAAFLEPEPPAWCVKTKKWPCDYSVTGPTAGRPKCGPG